MEFINLTGRECRVLFFSIHFMFLMNPVRFSLMEQHQAALLAPFIAASAPGSNSHPGQMAMVPIVLHYTEQSDR